MKKIILTTAILAFLQVLSISVKAQIITTIAGDSIAGNTGDGGLATAAELKDPAGVTVDAAGNVYIVEESSSIIRKINTSGIITTIAGNGTIGYSGDGGLATAAVLYYPEGIVVDSAGNIYIADTGNNCIRKINTSGIISTIVGDTTAGYAGDGGLATAAELDEPCGVAVDAAGNMYVADFQNQCIRKINTSGIISTIAGNGIRGFTGDGSLATAAELYYPDGVTVDAAGNVYIADYINNRIRKINTSGIISTIAGNGTGGYTGDGGPATAAEIGHPSGVEVDATGNVYIADYWENVIRKVNTSGIISTIAGTGTGGYSGDGGTATAAELHYPQGVAVNSAFIYIADDGNNRIRELSAPTGIPENNFSNTSINVFPNPSNGIFNIVQKNNFQKSCLEIYNVLGEKIISTTLSTSQTQINLSEKAKGIYFYKVISEDGKNVSEGKLVVQ